MRCGRVVGLNRFDLIRAAILRVQAAYREHLAAFKRVVEAAEAGDAARFGVVAQQRERLEKRVNQLAQDYGFRECGSGIG